MKGWEYFQRARDVGAAHGFFSVESKACSGLGTGHPQTPNPKFQTLTPKPQTPNPKPQTLNLQPPTPNPNPQTLNSPTAAMRDGRHEEGVALMRNALAAARLNETDDPKFEVDALGLPSTLNPQPSTLNPRPSTLNPQLSTLNPQP